LIRLILSQAEIRTSDARVAKLEAKLDLPKKAPDNSSHAPPSKGQKPSALRRSKEEGAGRKKRGKPHPGAHDCCTQIPRRIARLPPAPVSTLRRPTSRRRAQFSCRGSYDHHRDSADPSRR